MLENNIVTKECSLEQQLIGFFDERFAFIRGNKYPVMLSPDPATRFVMHFVPSQYHEIYLDIKNFDKPENYLVPLGETEDRILCEFNFDGIYFISSAHEKINYTQVFRDGRIEVVSAIAKSGPNGKGNLLPILKLQKELATCLENYLATLRKFYLPGPYYLFFRLLAVDNLKIDPDDITLCGYEGKGRNKFLVREELIFPHYRLEHVEIDVKDFLLPFFDIIWNAFGFRGAPKI